MFRLFSLVLVAVSSLTAATTSWGQAVSVDAQSLIQRLDAMEKRMGSLESRRLPTAGQSVGLSNQPNIGALSFSAADLEQRTTTLEEESSQLRGTSDRTLRAMERLAQRFDDYIKDLDMRLADIEARLEAASEAPTSRPAPSPTAAVSPTAAAAAPATSASPTVKIPTDLAAAEHYNKAYAFLTATDYPNAQAWFEEFLKRHAANPLADNAYYWLGEVYLVQNNPTKAVATFRDGLKAFPKGGKAPANLFKMGVALESLKQPALAKAAWEKLRKDYPKAPEAERAKDKLLGLKPE